MRDLPRKAGRTEVDRTAAAQADVAADLPREGFVQEGLVVAVLAGVSFEHVLAGHLEEEEVSFSNSIVDEFPGYAVEDSLVTLGGDVVVEVREAVVLVRFLELETEHAPIGVGCDDFLIEVNHEGDLFLRVVLYRLPAPVQVHDRFRDVPFGEGLLREGDLREHHVRVRDELDVHLLEGGCRIEVLSIGEQTLRVSGQDSEEDVVAVAEDDAAVVRFLVGVPAVQELGVVKVDLDLVGRVGLFRQVVPDGVEASLQFMSAVAEEIHDPSVEILVGVEDAAEVSEHERGVLCVVELLEEVLHVGAGAEFSGNRVLTELRIRNAVFIDVGVEQSDAGAGFRHFGGDFVHIVQPQRRRGGGGGTVRGEASVLGYGAVDLVKGEVLGRLEDLSDPFGITLVALSAFLRKSFGIDFEETALGFLPVAEDGIGVDAEPLCVDVDGCGVPGRAVRRGEAGEEVFETEGNPYRLLVVGECVRQPAEAHPVGEDLLLQLLELLEFLPVLSLLLVVLVDEFIETLDTRAVLFGDASDEGVVRVDGALGTEGRVEGRCEDVPELEGLETGGQRVEDVHSAGHDIFRERVEDAGVVKVDRKVIVHDSDRDGVAFLLVVVHTVAGLEVRPHVGRIL